MMDGPHPILRLLESLASLVDLDQESLASLELVVVASLVRLRPVMIIIPMDIGYTLTPPALAERVASLEDLDQESPASLADLDLQRDPRDPPQPLRTTGVLLDGLPMMTGLPPQVESLASPVDPDQESLGSLADTHPLPLL